MANKTKGHSPSKYRALVREAKSGSGKDLDKLISEALQISDPYYKALALFEISSVPKLDLKEAAALAKKALASIEAEERLWRRAELLSTIVRKIEKWREDAAKYRNIFFDKILKLIITMPAGEGLSQAILGCTPKLGCSRMKPLFNKSLKNEGFILDDAKMVIKIWAQQCKNDRLPVTYAQDKLVKIQDDLLRSKLLGYLYLQITRSKYIKNNTDPLLAAITTNIATNESNRLEAYQYLATIVETKEDLEIVLEGIEFLEEPNNKAKLMGTLAGRADKLGMKKQAIHWFKKGLKYCDKVTDPEKRVKVRLKVAQGITRLGEPEPIEEAYQLLLDDCACIDDEELQEKLYNAIEEITVVSKKEDKPEDKVSKEDQKKKIKEKSGINNILALYDTYEGGLKPVHFRVISRAAPLCKAFDLDLVLMGFPANDLNELVSQVKQETNVGKGGRYLEELLEQGRISLVPCSLEKPPKTWDLLGLPVATTSHPDEGKRMTIDQVLQFAKEQHPLKRVCMVLGLGRRGLPQSLLDNTQYHLELTGKNIPLETCSAIGVVAQQLKDAINNQKNNV